MNRNIGSADRAIRIIVSLALLGLWFVLDPPMRYLGLVGLVPIATALIGWCPLYALLGISTRGKTHA